ncbi:putative transferase CAF17, mitochondrial [Naviculisporaceae sp. PSN 640]
MPARSALRLPARFNAFICSGCLQSRQHHLFPLSQSQPTQRRIRPTTITSPGISRISHSFYSTSAINESSSLISPPPSVITSGVTRLTSRRLISVSGHDAAKYLQGVITANITNADGTPRTSPFYAAFLTAKGRVLHDVFLYPYNPSSPSELPTGDSFLIEVDASEAARLQQHIKRYKLRAKFDVRLLEESGLQVWHAWSDNTETLAVACEEIVKKNDILTLDQDPRAPGLGYRIISRSSLESPASLPQVQESAYTLHRYRLGVPEGQREILRDQALPLESNIDVMNGIDFRKGCYVGQELTIRTKHRGVVRKRILPVVVSDPSVPSEGSDITSGLESGYKPAISLSGQLALPDSEARIGRKEKPDRRVGQWLAGIGNVGLALCRLEVMTDLQVPGETASAGYNPEKDEFVVNAGTGGAVEGEELKVKAFVPEWLRKELEQPTAH